MPNEPDAPNAALVLWFQCGRQRRGGGDPEH